MAVVRPAIKGKLGDTEYHETTMPAWELIRSVRPARELDGWASMGIEERMQRDPDMKRIMTDIAPYIAKAPDRFFGSLIVLIYKGEVYFEGLGDFNTKIPRAYQSVGDKIGFLTIEGGTLIVLDGQHRLLALEKVIKHEVIGPESLKVQEDEVSVIFIQHESDEKTRRIFNKVNRYAKATTRGDNIITSEDDGYAILTRWLLRDDAPLGKHDGSEIVNWKSNTLSPRSTMLTTISAVYESLKLILAAHDVKLDEKDRPSDEQLEMYMEICEHFWKTMLTKISPFQKALTDTSRIPKMREDDQPTALLFKPAPQIALVKGLLIATANNRLSLDEALARVNRIDWTMSDNPIWKDVIVRASGAIDASAGARELTAQLIAYLIAADKMDQNEIEAIQTEIDRVRGYRAPLPEPVTQMVAS